MVQKVHKPNTAPPSLSPHTPWRTGAEYWLKPYVVYGQACSFGWFINYRLEAESFSVNRARGASTGTMAFSALNQVGYRLPFVLVLNWVYRYLGNFRWKLAACCFYSEYERTNSRNNDVEKYSFKLGLQIIFNCKYYLSGENKVNKKAFHRMHTVHLPTIRPSSTRCQRWWGGGPQVNTF